MTRFGEDERTRCELARKLVRSRRNEVIRATSPLIILLVGMTRFELATPRPPAVCATGLRHIPSNKIIKPAVRSRSATPGFHDCKHSLHRKVRFRIATGNSHYQLRYTPILNDYNIRRRVKRLLAIFSETTTCYIDTAVSLYHLIRKTPSVTRGLFRPLAARVSLQTIVSTCHLLGAGKSSGCRHSW